MTDTTPKIGVDISVCHAVEAAHMAEFRGTGTLCAQFAPYGVLVDPRPATRRRMAHVAQKIAATGYSGQRIAARIRAIWGVAPVPDAPTPELVASVSAVLQRRR